MMGGESMKKIIILLIFTLTFATTPALANSNDSQSCGKEIYNDSTKEKIEKYKEEDASLVESYTIDFINSALGAAGINSLSTLVFGNPHCIWNDTSDTTLVYGIFTQQEYDKIITPLTDYIKSVFSIILLLSMLISSLKLAFSGVGGAQRSEFWEKVKMWLVVTVFIYSFDLIIETLFSLNAGILSGFKGFMDSHGLKFDSLSMMTSNSKFTFTDIVVFFAEWILALFMNFIYIFRKIMILMLLVLGPVAGMSLMFSSASKMFNSWVRDLIGIVFLQSFHGLLLTIFLLFSTLLSGVNGTVFKMVMLIMFIPLTGMITSWLHLSDATSEMEKTGMMGVKTLATAASLSKYMKKAPTLQQNNISHQGRTKISALADGKNSKLWSGMKKGVGGLGGVIGGTAGLVLGPSGAVLGMKAGSGLAGGLLQGSRNVAAFGVNSKGLIGDLKDNGGIKNTFSDIGKRKEFFGNLGETAGALVGKGEAGRNIGHALSGVSRSRLLNSQELGGFGGLSLDRLKDMYPGADLKWIQDNKGSGLYMDKGNENFERISPLGEADPSLKNGSFREIGYRFNSPEGLKANGDGGYSLPQNPLNNPTGYLQQTTGAMLGGPNNYRLVDSSFDTSRVNPDNYFQGGLMDRNNHPISQSTGERVADGIQKMGGWIPANQNRHRGFS